MVRWRILPPPQPLRRRFLCILMARLHGTMRVTTFWSFLFYCFNLSFPTRRWSDVSSDGNFDGSDDVAGCFCRATAFVVHHNSYEPFERIGTQKSASTQQSGSVEKLISLAKTFPSLVPSSPGTIEEMKSLARPLASCCSPQTDKYAKFLVTGIIDSSTGPLPTPPFKESVWKMGLPVKEELRC
jgi:hypothetical protein